MNYDKVEFIDDKVILKNVNDFNVKQTLECGQCFRWEKQEENRYVGIAFEKVLEVEQRDNDVILYNTNQKDFEEIWFKYFDLGRDYSVIKKEVSKDEVLKKATEFGYGIRLLNQDPFELVISYIISARNSIPVISRTIKNISEKWGDKIEYKGKVYYTFPRNEVLAKVTDAELREVGGSFRSPYIEDTSKKIFKASILRNKDIKDADEEEFLEKYDLERIISLNDDECHKALQNYNGVGAKVADCIMLFSMGKTSAFPVDVWVKRAMMHFYNASELSLPKMRVFGREKFGNLAGFAQQYLFYYIRESGITL